MGAVLLRLHTEHVESLYPHLRCQTTKPPETNNSFASAQQTQPSYVYSSASCFETLNRELVLNSPNTLLRARTILLYTVSTLGQVQTRKVFRACMCANHPYTHTPTTLTTRDKPVGHQIKQVNLRHPVRLHYDPWNLWRTKTAKMKIDKWIDKSISDSKKNKSWISKIQCRVLFI